MTHEENDLYKEDKDNSQFHNIKRVFEICQKDFLKEVHCIS